MPARSSVAAPRTSNVPVAALALIATVALIVRFGVAHHIGLGTPLDSDEIVYGKAAASLVAGRGFMINGVTTAKCMPGWPLLMAGVYAIFGVHPYAVRVLTCILGGLMTVPIGLAAYRVAGRGAALLAAGGAALYPPMVLYSSQALTETPTLFWLALALWLLFEGRARGGWGWLLGAGIAFGLGCLTRGTIIAFAGAACIAFFAVPPREWLQAAVRSALIVAGVALVLLPWVARNAKVFGRATVSTQSQTQLWQGAHPGATGLNRIDWPRTKEKFTELRDKDEVAVSDIMGAESKAFIREHPGEFVRLGWVKAWELWKPWSANVRLVENLAYALDATPLAILGLASAFVAWRRRYDRVFLLAGLVLFTVLHMLYTAIVRYRVPADVVLVIYASALVTEFVSRHPGVVSWLGIGHAAKRKRPMNSAAAPQEARA